MLRETMLPPANSLSLAICLYETLEIRHVEGRNVVGRLPIELDFNAFVSALETESLLVAEDLTNRTLEFRLPSALGNAFYLSMDELTATPERRIQPPKRFYVADLSFLYEEQASFPSVLQAYFHASTLFRLLQGVADHCNTSDCTLVFWEKGKIILTSDYSKEDLAIPIEIGNLRSEFFESNTHSKQKHTIIRMALLEEFNGCLTVRLGDLLKRFHTFSERVFSSYQLYVSEFSFEKIKAEIEKEKLEFTTKLNKVFSDIQSQLLAIPVALVLVGGQLESTNQWTLKNGLIWVGVLFFCILMNLLIRNQRNTLAAIRHEIDQQWLQIRGKHSSVADRFSASYKQLEFRHLHQERLIRAISGMVAFSLAATSSLYVYYSVPEATVCFAAWVAIFVFFSGFLLLLIQWWHALPRSNLHI